MTPPTAVAASVQDLREDIRSYLLENLLFSDDRSRLPDDASLLERGIVDSTGVLEVVLFLEERYGVQVEDRDLLPENFDSVARIAAFVARLQAAAAA